MKGILLDSYDLYVSMQTLPDGKKQGMEIGDILAQNQAIILDAHPGEIKENPTIGVGLADMVNDHNPILWRTAIREALEADGQTVNSIAITTSSINIDSAY